jgi:hypothetical protein
MAVDVVDLLEPVEIQADDRKPLTGAPIPKNSRCSGGCSSSL